MTDMIKLYMQEMNDIISDGKTCNFQNYLDARGTTKFLYNGYVSTNGGFPHFRYTMPYEEESIEIWLNQEISIQYMVKDKKLMIIYPDTDPMVYGNGLDFTEEIDVPALLSEEEYFQFSTINEYPITEENNKILIKFFSDVQDYKESEANTYYQEYLDSCK